MRAVQPDPKLRAGWVFPAKRAEAGHLTVDPIVHAEIVKLAALPWQWSRKHFRKSVRTYFGKARPYLGRLALGHALTGMDAHYDASDPVKLVRAGLNEFCEALDAEMNPPTPKNVAPFLRRKAA